MTWKVQAEIDALRAEVQGLAQAVRELQQLVQPTVQREASDGDIPADNKSPGQAKLAAAHELARRAHGQGFAGMISYAGAYQSGERGYRWATEATPVEELLGQDDDTVAQVLAALGNKQRLILLKAILKQPASVSDLITRLGMGTTGRIYHHLKPLQAADLIAQEEGGQFVFKGHRAQGLLMLLAGVHDLLDPRYSAGTWEPEPPSSEA